MTAGFETRAIHAGQEPDPVTGAVITPITLATTFAQQGPGEPTAYEYGRSGNPTRHALETCLASLESAAYGYAFASGMSAEDCVLRVLAGPGTHVALPNDIYGGTYRLINRVFAPVGVTWSVMDFTDLEALEAAWPDGTTVVWIETPTNPTLRIIDVAAVAKIARARGARLVVDNTFATPYLQRPLELGADVVVHSATKYLGGHSDVVGGFVATNDPELASGVAFLQNAVGAVPGPTDCYLVLRGVKTLGVRMDRHCANAKLVAEMLSDHPKVARVLYPGLPTHEGHETAARQMRDFGGMVSFHADGGESAAVEIVTRTRLFTLAESLGAVESLIEHPARMTHASTIDSPFAVDPSLVRLSVGIETAADLLADLAQALDAV
jgi:cystathionine gamma-synthase